MSATLAADLDFHVADAVRRASLKQMAGARIAALFAGIAATKIARAQGVEIAVPEGLAAEPLAGWFKEGVGMALDRLDRARPAAPAPVRFQVRGGGNRAARALGEGGE